MFPRQFPITWRVLLSNIKCQLNASEQLYILFHHSVPCYNHCSYGTDPQSWKSHVHNTFSLLDYAVHFPSKCINSWLVSHVLSSSLAIESFFSLESSTIGFLLGMCWIYNLGMEALQYWIFPWYGLSIYSNVVSKEKFWRFFKKWVSMFLLNLFWDMQYFFFHKVDI